jgi:hypothetical protein
MQYSMLYDEKGLEPVKARRMRARGSVQRDIFAAPWWISDALTGGGSNSTIPTRTRAAAAENPFKPQGVVSRPGE